MTLRGTLLLFVTATLVVGLFLFLPRNQDHPSNASLFHGPLSQITRITIKDGASSRSLTHQQNHWEMNTTPPDQADTSEIMNLLTLALEVKPLDILSPQELKNQLSLSALGLQDGKRSLLLHYEHAPDQILYFGNEAAGEKKLFARLGSQKEVVVIPSTLADLAFQPTDHFRNHHLSSLSLEALQEIKLSQSIGELRMILDHNQWKMTAPTAALVSSNALSSWITPLLEAPILERLNSDQENLAADGLEEPRATLTLSLADPSLPSMTLSLGKMVATKEAAPAIYVRSSERHAIFKIPAALEKVFLISPDVLREHQFCTLNLDMVDRIEITRGDVSLLLRRQSENHENWITEGKNPTVIPGAAIQKMVSGFEKVTVSSFELATPSKLKDTGIEPASHTAITLRFIAHLSENSVDEDAGDFLIKEIRFGTPNGSTLFARINQNAEIVEVPSAVLTNFIDLKLLPNEQPPAQ